MGNSKSHSHLRMLLNFFARGPNCYDTLEVRHETLTEFLNHLTRAEAEYGSLSLATVRTAMKSVLAKRIDIGYLYAPMVSLDVRIGDIGFIRGNSFTRLCNVDSDIQSTVISQPSFFISSPEHYVGCETKGDQIM
jgi:hypothetical protein